MSEQETVSVRLVKLLQPDAEYHEESMKLMGDDEIYDYMYDNDLPVLDGDIWKVVYKKAYEYGDFIKVSKKTNTELEFTASWYNGGCSFSEVVESAFAESIE